MGELRRLLEEKEGQVAELTAQLQQKDEMVSYVGSEIERMRVLFEEKHAQSEARHTAAMDETISELAKLRGALSESQEQRQQHQQQQALCEGELKKAMAQLSQAEREARQCRASVKQTESEMRRLLKEMARRKKIAVQLAQNFA